MNKHLLLNNNCKFIPSIWRHLQFVIVVFLLSGICSTYANNIEGTITTTNLSTTDLISSEMVAHSGSDGIYAPDNCDKKCNATLQCDGKGRFTKEILNKYCECITVFVATPTPTCPLGEKYDATTCGCTSTTTPICTKTCDTRILCDGKGNLTTQVLNAKDCECEIQVVTKPTCPIGKVYSDPHCGCIVQPVICTKTCDTRIYCDGNGGLTTQVLNTKDCKCETESVAKPTCPIGKVYNASTCGCETQTIACVETCDTRVVCDGKGGLTKQVLNTKDCKCETVSVAKPTCSLGRVYDSKTCSCTNAILPPTTNCNEYKISGDKGIITVSGLTAPNQIVKIFDDKQQIVFNCTGNCKETEIIKNVVGTYSVHVGAYTKEWHYICGINEKVTVDAESSVIPEAGECSQFSAKEVNGQIVISGPTGKNYTYSIVLINEKGEQICEELTIDVPGNDGPVLTACPDGFPKKLVGSVCDDKNPNTENDKIQADGCTCAGVIVAVDPCAAKGGDKDEDGICALDDCDDSNPLIGKNQIPGTPCDDKNPNTQKDVIQTNGCTCAGVLIDVDPCAAKGGDKDKDGICALDDCDDSNPLIGKNQIPGTHCDDKNPNTQKDVIQTDGCTCRGTAIVIPDPCAAAGGDEDKDGVCAAEDCNDKDASVGKLRYCPAGTVRIDNCTCTTVAPDPCAAAGGDEDKDGVCAAEDCNDKDPTIGNCIGFGSSGRSATTTNSTTTVSEKPHSFYPNPAKGSFFLDLNAYNGQQGLIRLVNQFGKVVQQLDFDQLPKGTIELNIESIEDGLHFLNITIDNEEVMTEKIMINKF